MKRPLLAAALLLLAAAGKPWRWDIPTDVAPPPVPSDNMMNAAKVELGRRLFYDADLSADGTMSCATCHEQKHGFADSNATRPGVHGDPGRRNAPGLANVAWLSRLTLADPFIDSLETQALTPLFGEHPVEMGMKGLEAELVRRLSGDACYRQMFARAFPDKKGRIDIATISAGLAAFERTLISFDSPYDTFLQRKNKALSNDGRNGLEIFMQTGCASCHSGRDMTDGQYHRLEPSSPHDPGLIEKTGKTQDAGQFRTPSLRNVEVTGPWWHDGSASSLEEAISRHGTALPDGATPSLVAFLKSLTDQRFLTDPRLAMPNRACGKKL